MELTAVIPAAVRSIAGLSNGAAGGAGNTSFHHYSALQSMKLPQLPTCRNPFSLKNRHFFQTLCNNRRTKDIEENLVWAGLATFVLVYFSCFVTKFLHLTFVWPSKSAPLTLKLGCFPDRAAGAMFWVQTILPAFRFMLDIACSAMQYYPGFTEGML